MGGVSSLASPRMRLGKQGSGATDKMSNAIEKLRRKLRGSIAFRLATAVFVLVLSTTQFCFGIAEHSTSMLIYSGLILLLGITIVTETFKRRTKND
ncbi:hypothetical protein [Mycobacteroides abscessus]|uniref:hypothetical protein n=1 Tax=Mycobacteroides abscessus TaxID=36809 RepID=UPI001F33E8A1|nr:hypothetical protein [Mycobacteroides abscessus]